MQKLFTLLLFCSLFQLVLLAQNVSRIDNTPFPGTNKPDTLFYTGKSMTDSEVFATGSLSGILARTKPMIMQWQYFHQEIVRESNPGIKILDTYSNNFQGLLNFFAGRLDGYILCDAKSTSANVAATLSGILNAVAIPANIESKAKAAGLSMLLDVRGKDEIWAISNYGDRINKNFAFSESLDNWLGLVDYTAYTGGIRYFDQNINGTLAQSVYNFMNPGAYFFGWWVSEYEMIEKLSTKGFKMLPSGGLKNLATHTNIDVPIVKQKEPLIPFKVVPNVHTVCFVITDGDHIGWVAGAGYWDQWIWKSDNQSRLNLGFTVTPALSELTPIIYNDIINGLQTTPEGRNVAIAAPSGAGYYFPGLSPNHAQHCVELNNFMRKADMSIVNVIDIDNGTHNPAEYLKQKYIDALFYYSYGAQYTGKKGKISWYKGKPSIGARFAFWGNSEDNSAATQERVAQNMANILNSQSTNIYSEAGYSLIPVHIWTEKPHDVVNLISKLGPNVRVVAPDEFVWLVKKNVARLPVGDGFGLKAEYFNNRISENATHTRIDKKIDFEWGEKSPVEGIENDNFSVRWTGQIQALYSEEYNLFLNSDDGVKLTIDGQTLIDATEETGKSERNATFTFTAGNKYDIQLEYTEKSGDASCIFEWESPSQIRQIVPFTQLYANPLPTKGLVTVFKDEKQNGFSAGLKIGNYNSSQLTEKGITANEISSIQINEGFKAILYSADNFTGDSLILTTSTDSLTDKNWDNKTMSVRIKANGVTDIKGAYLIKNRRNGFYMNVGNSASATGYNTNIYQYSLTRANNQIFQFEHLGDGIYKIMARHSKMVLTVAKMGYEENANIHQWKYHDSGSQKFIAVATNVPGNYKFISIYSGMVVNAATNTSGGNIQMNSNLNQFSAMWSLIETTNREGDGDGLNGDYYAGKNFTLLRYSRIDPQINFNWGESNPGSPIANDNFSVRWTGFIQPRYNGTYTFHITSDNGRRLWIDDKLIIDKWISDWDVTYSGTINLTEMKKHKIKIEYFEEAGGANICFEWESNAELREVVPKSQLYSHAEPNATNDITESQINIYPNPTNDKIYFGNLHDEIKYEIFDAQGLKIETNTGTFANTAHLIPGIYFIRFEIDGRHYSAKFLRSH
ncbi:MAG: RICIN domain-containing protein [Paludibacteraceae bacterium]|nr:RICIN domain-containing protein [Paludibacteraceae bacterium]